MEIFMVMDLSENGLILVTRPFKDLFSHDIETSQLICRGNRFTGF